MPRNHYATQGRLVIAALKRQPLTYAGMLALKVGNSPWKRAVECLKPTEQIVKRKRADGFITWRVISATRWTA